MEHILCIICEKILREKIDESRKSNFNLHAKFLIKFLIEFFLWEKIIDLKIDKEICHWKIYIAR